MITMTHDAVASAVRTIETEQAGIEALAEALENGLGTPFRETVDRIRRITGRVIVTGVGKSGHIASKMAATLASTGTPAYFVHPVEANHGDLGMIARDDAIIALSWSGESRELGGIIEYSRRFQIPLVALTSGEQSTLARGADIVLALPKSAEACPHGLAPTTSTIIQLAMGDALAVALLESRGFTANDFRDFHPGGKLGANLTSIADIMHSGERIPLIKSSGDMRDAIVTISQKGFGCVGVIDIHGRLAGIVTDGDLRRHIHKDLLAMSVNDVMTVDAITVTPDTLAASALKIINELSITALMVLEDEKPVGIVHLHDLLRIGVA
ncbi:MAG: KpsF/GutQ family sugar-phosphate isomerase [Pseudomonadota bacterium]